MHLFCTTIHSKKFKGFILCFLFNKKRWKWKSSLGQGMLPNVAKYLVIK